MISIFIYFLFEHTWLGVGGSVIEGEDGAGLLGEGEDLVWGEVTGFGGGD